MVNLKRVIDVKLQYLKPFNCVQTNKLEQLI